MNNETIFDKELLLAILDYINNNRGQLPDAETPGFEKYDDDEIVKSINYLSKDLQVLTLKPTPVYESYDNSGNWGKIRHVYLDRLRLTVRIGKIQIRIIRRFRPGIFAGSFLFFAQKKTPQKETPCKNQIAIKSFQVFSPHSPSTLKTPFLDF